MGSPEAVIKAKNSNNKYRIQVPTFNKDQNKNGIWISWGLIPFLGPSYLMEEDVF